MSDLHLNLEKGKEALKLDLKKRGVENVAADLAFVLDVSGSFHGEHLNGDTQALLERLVPWGMLFDPDQKLDVFTFSSGQNGAHHAGDITPANCERYIQKNIVNRVPGYGLGTDYGYVIEAVLQNFGWLPTPGTPGKKAGFFGKLLGQKDEPGTTTQSQKRRSIVLFVTDGENSDHDFCRQVLAAAEKRGDETYFLFIGIGGPFHFLKEIADRYSNTGLVIVKNIKAFCAKTNEEMNQELIGDELVTWLKK